MIAFTKRLNILEFKSVKYGIRNEDLTRTEDLTPNEAC